MPRVPFVPAYDDEDLLAELRRVAAVLPEGPITERQLADRTGVSVHTMLRRFGSWHEVLVRAGLGDRYSGRSVSPKMRSQCSRTLTDAEIIAELQRVAAAAGSTTLVQGDVWRHSTILGMNVLRNRFGSFADALAAAVHGQPVDRGGLHRESAPCLGVLRPRANCDGDASAAISDQCEQLHAPVRVLGRRFESGRWGHGIALPGQLGRDGPQKDVLNLGWGAAEGLAQRMAKEPLTTMCPAP